MRSIWRETKFAKLLIISNLLDVIESLANGLDYLHVEKRKQRYLQMTKLLS
jgi:hypothetical protein